jgi:hypothetical protein
MMARRRERVRAGGGDGGAAVVGDVDVDGVGGGDVVADGVGVVGDGGRGWLWGRAWWER